MCVTSIYKVICLILNHIYHKIIIVKKSRPIEWNKKKLSVLAIGLFPEANIYLALNYLASYGYTITTIFLLSNHGSKNGGCAKIKG